MANLAEKILTALAILLAALVVSPAAALPIDLIDEDVTDEEEEDGGLEKIVGDVADTVVDPASSTVEETTEGLLDEAEEVEDAADEVVPGDVELVEEVEETAEPVTSGEAVDELVDDGGELVGEIEEEVYSVPVVGDAAEEVVDTAEPMVDELTDAAEPAVDLLLPEEEEEQDSEDGDSDTGDAQTNGGISEQEPAEDFSERDDDDEPRLDVSYEPRAEPNPDLTEEEKEEIIEEAADVPGLKEWSSEGWEYAGMDFVGTGSDEVEWEQAIVYMHLPDGAGDPPEECYQGWSAAIGIDLETGEAEDSGFPTESSNECASKVILEDPNIGEQMLEAFTSIFSPKTDITPSFVIAEADDVAENEVYGNTAHIKTPSYDDAIFDHMDKYVAHLLNQKWDTSPAEHMVQVGWLITAVEGCADCGEGRIPKNTAAIAFTDTSVFGNLEARRVPFDWQPDKDLVAETACNEDSNYVISVLYGDEVFNHNTRISCESADNDSKISNSVFFENWNTVESSEWAQDIGAVEAHSAHGFVNSRDQLSQWSSSTNEEQRCDSSRDSTGVISNSLSEGKIATWSELGSVPPAC